MRLPCADAPIALTSFNRRVGAVTGIVDPALADSIEALLADQRVPKLPNHGDPAAANRAALAAISQAHDWPAPVPFMLAMFVRESNCRHYAVPETKGDEDNYIVLGLLYQSGASDEIASRGYGIGQYTISHHPPTADEVRQFVSDPVGNVMKSFQILADKFAGAVLGKNGADDRKAEHQGPTALQTCRYSLGDPRRMSACQACAEEVRKVDLAPDTPLYPGARKTYGQASVYRPTTYRGVPDRAGFLCDWPYAMRRYNGDGPDSYNYQAIVLRNLLEGSGLAPAP